MAGDDSSYTIVVEHLIQRRIEDLPFTMRRRNTKQRFELLSSDGKSKPSDAKKFKIKLHKTVIEFADEGGKEMFKIRYKDFLVKSCDLKRNNIGLFTRSHYLFFSVLDKADFEKLRRVHSRDWWKIRKSTSKTNLTGTKVNFFSKL